MLKKLVNEARFNLTITTTGPLLIRSGHPTLIGPDMTPVLTRRGDEWEVYLPGSSLKGVVRSHVEKVCRTLSDNVVCNPFRKIDEEEASCNAKFQQRKDRKEVITSVVAYRDACPVCRLFGSTQFIGRVSINDAHLVDNRNPRPTEHRDGVGIDRLTGGAYGGALFNLEAISAGVSFETDIYLRNFELWQLGMLLLTVQDLEDGLVRIGSGRSRGLGSVKGAVSEITISHIKATNTDAAGEIWGMGKFLADDLSYGTSAEDVLQLQEPPVVERRGIRQQMRFDGDSLAQLRQSCIDAFVNRITTWN